MNDFTFSPDAMAEFLDWIKKDKKTANKIYSLIEDIRRNGAMQGIGKPEPLKLPKYQIGRQNRDNTDQAL
ncbi:MAG: type II toxin-antitoxin system YoeB family toxin [Lachnospiraceae bacterium]|nr:type II toxin-antitoxin system YoeB family toxin [Lachnospiraceae bacterium]